MRICHATAAGTPVPRNPKSMCARIRAQVQESHGTHISDALFYGATAGGSISGWPRPSKCVPTTIRTTRAKCT